jgi:tetratricopeptide (TPR) repeat protein
MPYDAFISHSSRDREIADAIVGALEAAGLACWVAPRDVPAAVPFSGAIVQAIRQCRVLVLVLTADSAESHQVLREVQQAAEAKVPILEFRSRGVRPRDDLDYYLSPNHRLEWTLPVEAHLPELVEAARKLVAASGERPLGETRSTRPSAPWFSLALRTRRLSCSFALLLLLMAPTAILVKLYYDPNHDDTASTNQAGSALMDYKYGMEYLRDEDVDRAIAAFTEAIEDDPKFALAYAGRGRAWLLKGQVDAAVADFEKALALVPDLDDEVRPDLQKARARGKLPELPEDVFAPDRD